MNEEMEATFQGRRVALLALEDSIGVGPCPGAADDKETA